MVGQTLASDLRRHRAYYGVSLMRQVNTMTADITEFLRYSNISWTLALLKRQALVLTGAEFHNLGPNVVEVYAGTNPCVFKTSQYLMGKSSIGSPDTIRETSSERGLSNIVDHLNTCVCNCISGLFNLMDTLGAVVSRTSKWSWNWSLTIITGPVGWFDGRATKL